MDTPWQDPEWQRRLDQITQPNGKLSWLHLFWESGYAWEPVGRWVIGQVIPSASIDRSMRELLEGENPADHGHFEEDEFAQKRWVTHLPGISRRQWHFYNDTGNHLKAYWVCQGSHGGHRIHFNFVERGIITLNGGDPVPPTMGDLPYAEPNERTFAELEKRDMLRKYSMGIDYMESKATRVDDAERRGLEEMRTLLWKDMEDQVKGYADEMEFHMREFMNMAPTVEASEVDRDLEELKDNFILQGA